MTSRNMNPTLATATQKSVVQYYEIIKIEVGVGYYITNAPWDITFGGHLYQSAGALISFDTVTENIGFEIERLGISIGGIAPIGADSQPFIKTILGLDYVDRPVTITRLYYTVSDTYIDSVQIYSGFITSASAASGLGENGAAVRIETSNNWTDFGRKNGRLTNDTKQQSVFPGDLGFEYCREVQKQIEWKEE